MHKFKDNNHRQDIRFNQELCPNPCKNRDFNPCEKLANTLSSICMILDNDFMLYDNNYKCFCKYQYEWDPNTMSCRLRNLCENNTYCGGFEKSSRCNMLRRSHDLIALGFSDYEITCTCTAKYMGQKCEKIRDPCIENNKGLPGHKACGFHGVCEGINGTHEYNCICGKGWDEDTSVPFKNCFQLADPCNNLICVNGNGHCVNSFDRTRSECVCNQGFTGTYCETIIGEWRQWQQWTSCYPSCGIERIRNRTRECSDLNDLSKCYGIGNEFNYNYMFCKPKPCIIEGNFSEWSEWSQCENGFSKRRRKCEFEKQATYDIKLELDCVGNTMEYMNCGKISFYLKMVSPIWTTIILSIIIFSIIAIYLKKLIKIYQKNIANLDRKKSKVKNN